MKSVPTNEVISIPAKTAIPNEIRLAAPGSGGDDQRENTEDESE